MQLGHVLLLSVIIFKKLDLVVQRLCYFGIFYFKWLATLTRFVQLSVTAFIHDGFLWNIYDLDVIFDSVLILIIFSPKHNKKYGAINSYT
jgi:hypothetical protein